MDCFVFFWGGRERGGEGRHEETEGGSAGLTQPLLWILKGMVFFTICVSHTLLPQSSTNTEASRLHPSGPCSNSNQPPTWNRKPHGEYQSGVKRERSWEESRCKPHLYHVSYHSSVSPDLMWWVWSLFDCKLFPVLNVRSNRIWWWCVAPSVKSALVRSVFTYVQGKSVSSKMFSWSHSCLLSAHKDKTNV